MMLTYNDIYIYILPIKLVMCYYAKCFVLSEKTSVSLIKNIKYENKEKHLTC